MSWHSFPAHPSAHHPDRLYGRGQDHCGRAAGRATWLATSSIRITLWKLRAAIARWRRSLRQRGETVVSGYGSRSDSVLQRQSEQLVLALGGGALERLRNPRAPGWRLTGCTIVFLDAPLDTLLARCAGHARCPGAAGAGGSGRLARTMERAFSVVSPGTSHRRHGGAHAEAVVGNHSRRD